RGLGESSKIFILALNGIISCAPNWIPLQTDLQKRLGWGQDKMETAIKQCVKFGYLKVRQGRQKGKFGHNEFDFDIEGSFKNETLQNTSESASTPTFQPLGGKPPTVE